jgi:hypothetical protein
MVLSRYRFSFAILLFASLAASTAFSQQRGDPIGPLTKIATSDRAQKVEVGKTRTGKIVCYYREQGSSHTLDIGMTGDGAFIRLETGDSREMTPLPPLRIFAGKQMARGEYATDEFAVLRDYAGSVDFYVPKPSRGDFVIVAKGDATAFFEMVARARDNFVVVQSAADPKSTDVVAIYNFNTGIIPALLSCAKANIHATSATAAPAVPRQADIVKLFDNGNIYAVKNRPTRTAVFTLSKSTRITRIMTYHWNDGHGAPAGRIALRNSSGETFGPWQAIGEPGQGGVPSAYWVVEPDVRLPAGTYTIVDSNQSTWAQNSGSAGAGMASVEGYLE